MNDPTGPVISVAPVTLAVPGRGQDLGVRVQGAHDTRTTDESPERVALVRSATLAYLQTALGLDDHAWDGARAALAATGDPLGRIESR
jgi:hypothetical protein